jgi:hypothetical protein
VNRSLAVSALASWLLAEALGAYMLRRWVASGAVRYRRARPDSMSLPVLLAHAGLNLAGMACWISFVLTRSAGVAWLALGFLIPAIGLGISTVSVWTPYPVRRAALSDAGPPPWNAGPPSAAGPPREGGPAQERDWRHSAIPDPVLARALEDEAVASKLTEELLARNLAYEARADRAVRLDIRALVPLAHGVLALATFVLATLTAIGTS